MPYQGPKPAKMKHMQQTELFRQSYSSHKPEPNPWEDAQEGIMLGMCIFIGAYQPDYRPTLPQLDLLRQYTLN